jgi:hypothetical protein
MSTEQNPWGGGSSPSGPAHSPRPLIITLPPGLEVKIRMGKSFSVQFDDGSAPPCESLPGDSSRQSPRK